MKLSQLLSIYPQLRWGNDPHRDVVALTQDSRVVGPGVVFVAVRGSAKDGHDFLPQVCAAGAAAVVVEKSDRIPSEFTGAVVKVSDSRVALDRLAAHFYGRPAEHLFCVGVTGTNGKTSTTYMIEAILARFGWKTGVMGTINHHLGDHIWPSQLTTPDPLTLQKRLAEFRSLGAEAATFEVSSHALDQRRADQIPFDAVVFTNLTRDHLDYHGTLDSYFAAKERLFREILSTSTKPRYFAIINNDDPYGRKIEVAPGARVWTYGQSGADFSFQVSEQSFAGSRVELKTPRGDAQMMLSLPGLHNVYNATAAVAVGLAAGASLGVCLGAMQAFTGVPGRLQRVPVAQPISVFVDYAHTDDALKTVLFALKEVRRQMRAHNRIILVFGCGGDRDRGKRPLMAKAAIEGADLVFVTSDNPRTEDPQAIIEDILTGVPDNLRQHQVFTEVDRRSAIAQATKVAREGDVILIAGKGHEDYQIVGHEKRPFSDATVVQELLA